MGTIIFNKVSTADMGVVVQTPPTYSFPEKGYDVVSIEGRSGDIVIPKDSYSNVRKSYQIAAVFKPNSTFISNAGELIDWLMSTKGYARLEDSYEPDFYRMALYRSQGEFTNFYDQVTTMNLMFECKPQRYLKSGETLISIPTNGVEFELYNPEGYTSLPLIKVSGKVINIEIFAGDKYHKVEINNEEIVNDITIDSELQDCYITERFLNNVTTLTNEFPKLYSGYNRIKITGENVSNAFIKPNWWRL